MEPPKNGSNQKTQLFLDLFVSMQMYLYVQKQMCWPIYVYLYAYECLCTSMCVDGNEYESYVNAYAHANERGLKTGGAIFRTFALSSARTCRVSKCTTLRRRNHQTVKKCILSGFLQNTWTRRHIFDAAYLIGAGAFLFSNLHPENITSTQHRVQIKL